jgi:hypothetical protein
MPPNSSDNFAGQFAPTSHRILQPAPSLLGGSGTVSAPDEPLLVSSAKAWRGLQRILDSDQIQLVALDVCAALRNFHRLASASPQVFDRPDLVFVGDRNLV